MFPKVYRIPKADRLKDRANMTVAKTEMATPKMKQAAKPCTRVDQERVEASRASAKKPRSVSAGVPAAEPEVPLASGSSSCCS